MSYSGPERRSQDWINEAIRHIAETNQHLKSIDENITELKEKVKTQNGRVNNLEKWRSWMSGGMAIIVFGMPAILWLFTKAIENQSGH